MIRVLRIKPGETPPPGAVPPGHRQYHRAPAESTVIIAFREAATRFIGLASIAISA